MQVQMGSIAGALIAFAITDKIGRLWATRQLCLLWVLGVIIFLTASTTGNIGQVYAGRFIAGMGIGQTTVVAPTYLAEIAPRFTRGFCVCMFSGSVYLGIMLSYFASWGSSIHISSDTSLQWVIPNLMHIYFSSIIFFLSFGAIESPRWLLKVHKKEKAVVNLCKIRNLPADHWYIQSELLDIDNQLEREKEATSGTTWVGPIKELVTIPANQYRLMLSVFSQLLGQWSGANSITIYGQYMLCQHCLLREPALIVSSSPIFRHVRHLRTEREALRNSHLRRSEVHLLNHLCSVSDRLDRPQASTHERHHAAVPFYAVYGAFPRNRHHG